MNTDIEDFINTKNKLGINDYNNIDVEKYDYYKCKKIFNNLLEWIYINQEISNIDITLNTDMVKLFEQQYLKDL